MMRKLQLLLLFISVNAILLAQDYSVEGRCTDRRGVSLDNVKVFSEKASPSSTFTNSDGQFQLFFKEKDTVEIIFRTAEYEEIRTVILTKDLTKISKIKFSFQQERQVTVVQNVDKPFEVDMLPPVDWQNIALGGIEKGLIYTTVATSNNELTSNYNVRGGSYDENLVYVNGFLINRPFLTRSGQQEGMSFLHTALVQGIQFSGGGFDARYGDKLSSVLDITYKTPTEFHGSVMASLLGVEAHVEATPTARFNYLVGARYRSNGYLLNALPTKGAYNPVFYDAQILTNYSITENLTWSVIGHFSSNNYRFKPQSSKTDFGTANEAYSFNVYFEGQEQTKFQTMTGGTSLKWQATPKTNLDLFFTVFNSVERENFDVLAEYYINELETDPSKEEFGDSIAVLGVGSYLNHARNRLDATIINIYHDGGHQFFKGFRNEDSTRYANHKLHWGVNYQMDYFTDKLSEWKMVDSAGFSLPQSNSGNLELKESLKSDLSLQAQRYTGYVQLNSIWAKNKKNVIVTVKKKYKLKNKTKEVRTYTDTIYSSPRKWTLSLGTRTGYTTANNEFFLTPRATVKFFPRAYMVRKGKIIRRSINYHFSTGMYYQPPFYREFRTFGGDLNLDVKAQKSAHFVLGTDVYFNMWNRDVPFKFTAEAYYKYMWDVNPYEIDNVRTRYYANNDAVAYAYGVDFNIHGQFVEGIESFFKLSFLSTKEDILNDFYYDYYNAAGEQIIFGISQDQNIVDSVRVEPGFIPRPTDQLVTFAALIQDRMPNHESFSVQMGLVFGSRLPYGPPDNDRYKDTLRMKSYFRVDLGMSYDFLYKKKDKQNFFRKTFTDAIISFEVFNLLGINNVLSKQWIQDTSGKFYAIPNYLTQRRFNLKLILRF